MHKSATKCYETVGKWCKNKHGASKIIDTFETYQWPAAWLGDVLACILDLPPAHLASPVSPWPMTGTSRRRRIAATATADEWCSSLVVDHRIERNELGIDVPSGFRLCSLVALSSHQVEASWMGCLSAHV
jgi:hypothetical protein